MARTALVVSAHSADFVWRCGGAIALHQEKGYAVTIVCLSYGERGESAKLWRQPGMTLERVKAARRTEAEAAAAGARRARHPVLRPRRLSAGGGPRGEVPARRRDPQGAAGLHAVAFPVGPLQHRPHVRDAGGARGADDRAGLGPQSRRGGSRRAAALPVRAAPDRADGMEARRLPRHLRRSGRRSVRQSNAWSARSICGTTTPTWRPTAPTTSSATPAGRRAGGRRRKRRDSSRCSLERVDEL